jgi:hypothetical protein
MNKKKTVAAALVSLGLTGVAAFPASAVSLSHDGKGDLLIFPYYTVRNGFETYLSIANTSPDTKILRVRFVEGMNGASVLEFDAYMPPNDVWTAAVIDNGAGGRVITSDTTCTTPSFVGTNVANFVNFVYNGNVGGISPDAGPKGLDRTREGHVEIFDMGVVPLTLTGPNGQPIVASVKHNAQGVPANCGALQTLLNLTNQLSAPSGGLTGAGYLVNSLQGLEFGFDPVVLADFARGATNGIWYPFTGFNNTFGPSFNDAMPRESRVFAASTDNSGRAAQYQQYVDAGWATGTDAVTAVLMASALSNEYVLEPVTSSQTDWVISYPTKRAYVNQANGSQAAAARAPFQRPFTGAAENGVAGSACDSFGGDVYNRQTQRTTDPEACFSAGSPITAGTTNTCYQTNVIKFLRQNQPLDTQSILGTRLSVRGTAVGTCNQPPVPVGYNLPAGFDNGWMKLDFLRASDETPASNRALTGAVNVYQGLPAVGFMLQTFTRTGLVINGVPSASGYGGNFVHKYDRRITPRTP